MNRPNLVQTGQVRGPRMAHDIPNVRRRGDTYFARLGVPSELRGIVGKSELTEEVGTTRREALQRRHAAMARLHARLEEARNQLASKADTDLRLIARAFYERELG